MKFNSKIFLLILIADIAIGMKYLRGSTVTWTPQEITGAAFPCRMYFVPTNTVLNNGTGLNIGQPKYLPATTNQTPLLSGDYTVSSPDAPFRLPFRISVPDDANTYNLTALRNPPVTYTYSNVLDRISRRVLPGANVTATTNNAGTVNETITLHASASGGTTYTNSPGVVGVISGGGIGTNTTHLTSTNYVNTATNTIWITLSNSDWNTKQSVVAVSNAHAATAAALVVQSNYSFTVAAWATNRFTAQAASNALFYLASNPAGYVTQVVTNGLASTGYVATALGGYVATNDPRVRLALTNSAAFLTNGGSIDQQQFFLLNHLGELTAIWDYNSGIAFPKPVMNATTDGQRSIDTEARQLYNAEGQLMADWNSSVLLLGGVADNSSGMKVQATGGLSIDYTRLYNDGYNTILRNDYGDIVMQPDGNFRTPSVYSPSGGYLYLYSDNTLTLGASGGIVLNDPANFNNVANFNNAANFNNSTYFAASNEHTFNGYARFNGQVDINSGVNIQSGANIYGTTYLNNQTIFSGESDFNYYANFVGGAYFYSDAYFSYAANFNSDSTVNFYSTPNFNSGATFNSTATFNSDAHFDTAYFNSDTYHYNSANFSSAGRINFYDTGGGIQNSGGSTLFTGNAGGLTNVLSSAITGAANRLIFTNAAGSRFNLVVNAATNGFTFTPAP